MNQYLRPIVSGIVSGVVWAFWHLLFYVFGSRPWSTFPQFIFTVAVISCLYTWIYPKTARIPLMIIFHVMHNLSNTIFINYHNPIRGGIVYFVLFIVIMLFDSRTLLKNLNLTHKMKLSRLERSISKTYGIIFY
jgi:membrane protease YdiL (CAAX protease family)